MITLRPYKACDANYIVSWIKSEISFYQWSADRIESGYPISAEQLNQYYEKEAANPNFWEMTALNEEGIPVGHFIMRYIDPSHKVVRLGFIILDETLRGRGLGRNMVSMAVEYAARFLHADKVTLGVFANNPSAKRCYEKAGFMAAGTSEFHIRGEKWECMEMECLLKKGTDHKGKE